MWENGKLTEWQVTKMVSWQNGKLTIWWVAKWQVDEMDQSQNGELEKCQVGEISYWQNGQAPNITTYFKWIFHVFRHLSFLLERIIKNIKHNWDWQHIFIEKKMSKLD